MAINELNSVPDTLRNARFKTDSDELLPETHTFEFWVESGYSVEDVKNMIKEGDLASVDLQPHVLQDVLDSA